LPCLLFFSIADTPLSHASNIPLFLFGAFFTLGSALLFWLLSLILIEPDKRGVFDNRISQD
jgi:predicted permease